VCSADQVAVVLTATNSGAPGLGSADPLPTQTRIDGRQAGTGRQQRAGKEGGQHSASSAVANRSSACAACAAAVAEPGGTSQAFSATVHRAPAQASTAGARGARGGLAVRCLCCPHRRGCSQGSHCPPVPVGGLAWGSPQARRRPQTQAGALPAWLAAPASLWSPATIQGSGRARPALAPQHRAQACWPAVSMVC